MTGKDKERGAETDPAALGEIMGAAARQWQEGWSDWVATLVPPGDRKAPGEASRRCGPPPPPG